MSRIAELKRKKNDRGLQSLGTIMNKGMDVTDERIQTNIHKIKQLNAYTKKISNGIETKIIFTMKK